MSRDSRTHAVAKFVLFVMLSPIFSMAQKWWDVKPYEEWSQDEVNELLQNSPWIRSCAAEKTDVEVKVEGKNSTSRAKGSPPQNEVRTYGAYYVLRLLTAKPVREAYLRQESFLEPGQSVDVKRLAGENNQKAQLERLHEYVLSHPSDVLVQGDREHIILSISYSVGMESVDGQMLTFPKRQETPLPEHLRQLQLSDLAPVTSLSIGAKKKAKLVHFEVEKSLVAKFYFPRMMAVGKPLITAGDKDLRFETRLGKAKVVAVFQIPKLIWKGQLEY